MSSDASNDSLYLDSNVALAQRMQSESEVELNEATHQDEGQKGVLAGIKHRFNVMAPGGSISEFGNNVSSAAQEQVVAAKETLLEGAVPAAQGAMRTVQDQMCTIAGGATESKETVSEGRFLLPWVPRQHRCDLIVDEGVMGLLVRSFPGGKRMH